MSPNSRDSFMPGLRVIDCGGCDAKRVCGMHEPLQQLITSAGHLLYSLDALSGEIIWHGPGPDDLFGSRQEEFTMAYWQSRVVEHSFVGALEGRDRQEAQDAFWRGEVLIWESEFSFQLPDGSVRWFKNHMTPIFEKGQVIGGLGFVLDIQRRINRIKELQRSEARAASIISSSPLGIHIFEKDESGDVCLTGWNEAAESITGFDYKAFEGTPIEETLGRAAGPELLEAIRTLADEGGVWDCPSLKCELGHERRFEVHSFSSEPGRVVCFFVDVTERAASEKRLKESEIQFRSLVESISEGLVSFDRQAVICYASPGLGALLEEAPADLVGRELKEMIAPEHSPLFKGVMHRVSLGILEPTEFKILRSSGERRWVRAMFQPNSTAPGMTNGILLDINDRKRNEAAVLAAEERMRIMLDAVGGQVAIVDVQGKITFASPQWYKAVGFESEAEILGRSGFNFLDAAGETVAREMLTRAISANDRTPIVGRMDIYTEDGRLLDAQITVVPMLDHPLIEGLICRMEIFSGASKTEAA